MPVDTSTRRSLLSLGAAGTIVALTARADPALAYQGNMERALSSLYDALASLREATANKGGHRGQAMGLIQQAINQVQQGIDYADEHGGG